MRINQSYLNYQVPILDTQTPLAQRKSLGAYYWLTTFNMGPIYYGIPIVTSNPSNCPIYTVLL